WPPRWCSQIRPETAAWRNPPRPDWREPAALWSMIRVARSSPGTFFDLRSLDALGYLKHAGFALGNPKLPHRAEELRQLLLAAGSKKLGEHPRIIESEENLAAVG